jgi:hypothetical protein
MSKSGGFITAPFGPGCYDLRLTSGDLVLFGSASHVAHRMRSLHPDSAGTRNNAGKRAFVGKHISEIEYRVIALASRTKQETLSATSSGAQRGEYVFETQHNRSPLISIRLLPCALPLADEWRELCARRL